MACGGSRSRCSGVPSGHRMVTTRAVQSPPADAADRSRWFSTLGWSSIRVFSERAHRWRNHFLFRVGAPVHSLVPRPAPSNLQLFAPTPKLPHVGLLKRSWGGSRHGPWPVPAHHLAARKFGENWHGGETKLGTRLVERALVAEPLTGGRFPG